MRFEYFACIVFFLVSGVTFIDHYNIRYTYAQSFLTEYNWIDIQGPRYNNIENREQSVAQYSLPPPYEPAAFIPSYACSKINSANFTWSNQDNITHIISGKNDNNITEFLNQSIPIQHTFKHTFGKIGNYTIIDVNNENLNGTIRIVEDEKSCFLVKSTENIDSMSNPRLIK